MESEAKGEEEYLLKVKEKNQVKRKGDKMGKVKEEGPVKGNEG